MPIYISERPVAVKAPSVYCDICSSSLDLVGELITFTATKTNDSAQSLTMGYGRPLYAVAGIPDTEDKVRKVMISRGWTLETIHGKELLICPTCRQKANEAK